MEIKDLKEKMVAVLGMGVEGKATAAYLKNMKYHPFC